MLAGKSGVSALTQDWAEQLPVRIAAQLAVDPAEVLDRVRLRRLDRSEAVALIAAHEAWADSGLADAGLDPERLAVSVGSRHRRRADPARPGRHPGGQRCPAGVTAHRADAHAQRPGRLRRPRARAPRRVSTVSPAPAPPAPRRSRSGWTSSGPAGPTWWWPAAPRRSSTRCRSPASPRCGRCRPATTTRSGPPGRGTGAATASCSARARPSSCSSGPTTPAARGARIYARLAGSGITSDGYDIVQPHPEGAGLRPGGPQGAARRGSDRLRHRARQRARHLHADR